MSSVTRLAVLGSPIGHSRSPALHAAAYAVLGLDWEYGAIEVTEDTLEDFIDSRDDTWRGLSLTMPLKRDILPLLDRRDPLVQQTGTANTVLFRGAGRRRYLHGFNTDVFGIARAFERRGHTALGAALILGGGATASSAIAAIGLLGAHTVHVAVRSPERAAGLVDVGRTHGVAVTIIALDALREPAGFPGKLDAVISTIPNGADAALDVPEFVRRHAVLFDVAYHPWPSALAADWLAVGGSTIGGLDMLVLQALMQVRIFVNGNPDTALDSEDRVLDAMWAAAGC